MDSWFGGLSSHLNVMTSQVKILDGDVLTISQQCRNVAWTAFHHIHSGVTVTAKVKLITGEPNVVPQGMPTATTFCKQTAGSRKH